MPSTNKLIVGGSTSPNDDADDLSAYEPAIFVLDSSTMQIVRENRLQGFTSNTGYSQASYIDYLVYDDSTSYLLGTVREKDETQAGRNMLIFRV